MELVGKRDQGFCGHAVLCWESGGTEQQMTCRHVAQPGLLPSALAVPSEWWLLSQL